MSCPLIQLLTSEEIVIERPVWWAIVFSPLEVFHLAVRGDICHCVCETWLGWHHKQIHYTLEGALKWYYIVCYFKSVVSMFSICLFQILCDQWRNLNWYFKQRRSIIKHINKDLISLFFPMVINIFKPRGPSLLQSLLPHRKRKYSWILQTYQFHTYCIFVSGIYLEISLYSQNRSKIRELGDLNGFLSQ